MNFYSKKCELSTLKVWILKLKSVDSEVKSVDSEVKSVDSEAKKCGFVKKIHTFSIVCYQKCGLRMK